MLFSTSPVKSISEKIKPLSESGKGKVSRLKFDRKNDYKTFLNFIKKNTRDLEEQQVKKEKKTSTGAFGIIGLGLLGGLFGGGKKDDNAFKTSFIPKALQRAKLDAESQAKKRRDASGASAFASIPDAFFKKNLEDGRKSQPYSLKNRGKEYIFNRDRRNKLVKPKSKKTVKESIINEEKVYNNNNKKKRFVNKKVYAEVGGSGTGGAGGNRRMINVSKTLPEDPNLGNRPPSSLGKGDTPEDIKRATKLTQDYEAGKITRQQYENELNKIKKFTPSDKTPKTLDQIAKDLGKGKKTLGFNFERPFQLDMGVEPTRINDKNFRNLSDLVSGDMSSDDLDNLIEINRIFDESDGKQLKLFNRRPSLSERFMFNPNTNRAGGSKFTSLSNFFGDQSFTAPNIPKAQPKLSGFDKFNRFTNRVMNSPAYKFGTFIGGMMANYKLEIVKQLLTPTPLADGTLEGKPGVNNFNSEQFMFDKETSVNIFNLSEGRESMIPFDANVKAPLVSKPQDLQKPTNEVFVDFEFDTTEDLFFMKMAGS